MWPKNSPKARRSHLRSARYHSELAIPGESIYRALPARERAQAKSWSWREGSYGENWREKLERKAREKYKKQGAREKNEIENENLIDASSRLAANPPWLQSLLDEPAEPL